MQNEGQTFMKLCKNENTAKHSEKNNVAALVAEKCAAEPLRIAGTVSSSHTVLSSVHVAGSIDLLDVAIQSDCNIAGSCKFTDVRIVSDCAIAGSAKLIKVTIGGALYVAGSCKANNLVAENASSSGLAVLNNVTIDKALDAWGGLTITNSKIRGLTTVQAAYRGSFLAEKTIFKDVVIIVDRRSGTLTMNQVTVDFISIRKNPTSGLAFFGLQIIRPVHKATLVLDGTIVDGDIDFQSLEGTVILRNGAEVRGQIHGGVIVTE